MSNIIEATTRLEIAASDAIRAFQQCCEHMQRFGEVLREIHDLYESEEVRHQEPDRRCDYCGQDVCDCDTL